MVYFLPAVVQLMQMQGTESPIGPLRTLSAMCVLLYIVEHTHDHTYIYNCN